MEGKVQWTKQLGFLENVNNEYKKARAEGFDLIQLPVEITQTEIWATLLFEVKENVFKVFDFPLPKGVRITEQGFNIYAWTEYMQAAIQRIADVGGTTLVWGEGKSRLLPVEGSTAALKEQFYQFVYILCGFAESFNITLCIEPLSERRTNFLNSIEEMLDCFKKVGKTNLALSVGLRTLWEIGLSKEDPYLPLLTYRNYIRHVHIENPTNSLQLIAPMPQDGVDYVAFLSRLKQAKYTGPITLPPDADAAALSYCKKLWEQVEG